MKAQRSLEEKLQIVLAGLKGQAGIAELCRRHGLSETTFYHWQKLFLEGGKEALTNGRPAKSSRERQLELEKLRIEEGLSVQRFCEVVGMSRATFGRGPIKR